MGLRFGVRPPLEAPWASGGLLSNNGVGKKHLVVSWLPPLGLQRRSDAGAETRDPPGLPVGRSRRLALASEPCSVCCGPRRHKRTFVAGVGASKGGVWSFFGLLLVVPWSSPSRLMTTPNSNSLAPPLGPTKEELVCRSSPGYPPWGLLWRSDAGAEAREALASEGGLVMTWLHQSRAQRSCPGRL